MRTHHCLLLFTIFSDIKFGSYFYLYSLNLSTQQTIHISPNGTDFFDFAAT